MAKTTQTERDALVFDALSTQTSRYGSCNIHAIANDARISEGQTCASLKRLKAAGLVEQVLYGWRAVQV